MGINIQWKKKGSEFEATFLKEESWSGAWCGQRAKRSVNQQIKQFEPCGCNVEGLEVSETEEQVQNSTPPCMETCYGYGGHLPHAQCRVTCFTPDVSLRLPHEPMREVR